MVKASTSGDLYAEIERLPEHLAGEIVQGELVVSPRPAPRHTHTASLLGAGLIGSLGSGGPGGDSGWWIYDEPELRLGADVLVPDLAGWRRERMPILPEAAYFSLRPDWVCEILSARSAALDRARKMPIYAREGVPFLWLVDPWARTLEVFSLREKGWLLEAVYEGQAVVHAPPFEAATLELAAWWAPEALPPTPEAPTPT